MSFYDRYAECCARLGLLPASQDSAEKIGCSRAGISTFAKTGNTPKGEIVAGAASMLNVSADYLLGLIEYPRPLKDGEALSPSESEALTLLRSLNEEGLAAALAMLSGLASQTVYKKCGDDAVVSKKNA